MLELFDVATCQATQSLVFYKYLLQTNLGAHSILQCNIHLNIKANCYNPLSQPTLRLQRCCSFGIL